MAGIQKIRQKEKKIDTTEAPVLFSPELAGGFIGHAISALSGSAQYRKTSFLLDAVGKQIFPDFFKFAFGEKWICLRLDRDVIFNLELLY